MRSVYLVGLALVIALASSCTSVPEELPDRAIDVGPTREIAPAEITVQEKSNKPQPITVEETTIKAGRPELENYRIDDGFLLFSNINGEAYKAPLSRIRYQEGSDRTNFSIKTGDYALILSDGTAKLLRYVGIEAGKKKAVFLDGERTIESYYLPVQTQVRELVGRSYGQRPQSGISTQTEDLLTLTFEEVKKLNPTVSFDEYADTQTIGMGELSLAGRDYRYYIGYHAGSPISLDQDSDGEIKGKKMPILTKSGETVQLWKK